MITIFWQLPEIEKKIWLFKRKKIPKNYVDDSQLQGNKLCEFSTGN